MRRGRLLAALLPVVAVLAIPSAAFADAGDRADGDGTLVWSHCPGGNTAVFHFSATSGPSGQSAAGTFSFSCSPSGTAWSGPVSCLVVSGNTAVLGGTIAVSNTTSFPVGQGLSFSVEDGGPLGAGDLFSVLTIGATCPFPDPFRQITSGDIAVVDVTEPPQSTPARVVLTPPAATSDVGTSHTVTATATTAAGTPSISYTILFTITGSVSTTGSCTTDVQGQCSFTYAGPQLPGNDLIRGCADANRNGVVDTGEPCGSATKTWTLPPPATVVLSPAMAINDVGTTHTVTATATTAGGAPSASYTVFFTVTGSVTATGSCTTDTQGQCSFTYAGPTFPGADLITGCADANRNGVADTGEPCGEATKVWTLPATTPGEVTGGGWIAKGGSMVSFGLIAESESLGSTPEGHCNVIDHALKLHIKCLTVDTLVVTPTHATFFGRATVGGVEAGYRIDVDDLGEPGTNDTFAIVTDTGYVAAGTLQGGNIQIHE